MLKVSETFTVQFQAKPAVQDSIHIEYVFLIMCTVHH